MAEDNSLSISVVIPNYNGRVLLEQNLPSVFFALEFVKCDYEIIVSDDASSDHSLEFLKASYPEILVIPNDVNGGFSVNINRGITRSSKDLVFLLNTDIALDKEYFKEQFKYFAQPDTFGVMGKVIDDRTGKTVEACKYPSKSVFKINSFIDVDLKVDSSFVPTYYLCGANALVKREKLLEMDGFNELYAPFYQEDLDLSLRAWERGWKCYYESNSICRHNVSATIKKYNTNSYIKVISTRNKLLLHYFHHRGLLLYLWGLVTALLLFVRWIIGHFFYYRAVKLFLKQYNEIRKLKKKFTDTSKKDYQYIPFNVIRQRIRKAIDLKQP